MSISAAAALQCSTKSGIPRFKPEGRRFNSASATKLSRADFHAPGEARFGGEVPICLTTD
jgi:hypothetical protein